jgi:hypothetical protein
MKNLIIIIVSFVVLTSISYSKDEKIIKESLKNIENIYKKHNSISYSVFYKLKSMRTTDVEMIKAKVEMIRETNDQQFSSIFWYNLSDSVEKYYDGKMIYSINHKSKTITTFDAFEGEIDGIIQDLDGDVIRVPFATPQMITGLIDETNKLSYNISKSNPSLSEIVVRYPNENNFQDVEMQITFNNSTFELIKIFSKFSYKGELQTNEWNISQIIYDKISKENLIKKFGKYKNKYKIVMFEKN